MREHSNARIKYYEMTIDRLLRTEVKRELTEKESAELDRVIILLAKELHAN